MRPIARARSQTSRTARAVIPLPQLLLAIGALALLVPPTAGAAAVGPYVIVSSDFSDSVEMYDLTGQRVRSFVPAGLGGLDSPQGITVGPDGNVYVSSANTDAVLRYNGATGAFMGKFQTGGGLDQPWYLTFGPDHNLYVSSSLTSRVLCYDGSSGAFLRTAATGGGLFRPDGLEFDRDGNLLVSDFYAPNSRIKKFNPATGQFLSDVVVDTGGLINPLEHRLSPDGSTLFVSSFSTNEIRMYDVASGAYLGDAASDGLNGPVGQLVLPGNGGLLVTSWNDSAIYRYDAASGTLISIFTAGGGLDHPNNLALLYVPEPAGALAALAVIAPAAHVVRRSRRRRAE